MAERYYLWMEKQFMTLDGHLTKVGLNVFAVVDEICRLCYCCIPSCLKT